MRRAQKADPRATCLKRTDEAVPDRMVMEGERCNESKRLVDAAAVLRARGRWWWWWPAGC